MTALWPKLMGGPPDWVALAALLRLTLCRTLLAQRHYGHGQARDAAGFAVLAAQTDIPNVCGAAQVHGARDRRHPAAAQAAQVVGIDLQADAVELAAVDAQVAGGGAQGFRQHHRCAAMQQAVRLMGARIDRHAGADGFVVEGLETNIQLFADGVFQGFVELLEIGDLLPQGHGYPAPWWG